MKAEPEKDGDVALHPVLIDEWMNWVRKGVNEQEEEKKKKREEEENKLREGIMAKFSLGKERYM